MKDGFQRVLGVTSVALLALAMLAGLERARGAAALSEAQAAEGRDDYPTAIAAARVAAESRVPYTHHADHALDLLERTAERAKIAREPATAALALRVARQAALATGRTERERALARKEEELFAQPEQKQTAPRPTGTGRGALGPVPQLGMMVGVAAFAAALWLALRREPRPKLCAALSALGTLVLAAARLFA